MDKEFVRVCNVNELQELKGFRHFVSENNDIAVFKIKGKIYAFDNVCPHNHTPKIHLGFVEDEHVLCPVHFYKFNIHTGRQLGEMGCTLKTYEVKIVDGEVYVEKPEDKTFDFDFDF